MNSSAYALKRILTLDDYDYKAKIKLTNFDNEIEDIEEDLLYRKYINILEQQFLQEHKKTNVGIEQAIEEIERERKRFNVINKVRSIFMKSSELCSILSFSVVFIYYLAILGKINLNPIYIIIWMPISFGAWLTNYINYEIWTSKNGRL
jgi:hypothetical protein